MAKIEWLKGHKASPYGVTETGPETEVSFMLKDSKRFPDTNGWGYATFEDEAASKAFKSAKPATASGALASCHGCHIAGARARDFVYTDYAQR